MEKPAHLSRSAKPELMHNPFTPRFEDLPESLPIFPLPGAVVMPGIQLPLNIFEPRYLSMVFDTLGGDRMVGMLQPNPNAPHTDPEVVFTSGTAGRITSFSETADGRLLIILTGVCRFSVLRELPPLHGYRRVLVDWSRFAGDYTSTGPNQEAHERLLKAFHNFLKMEDLETEWRQVVKLDSLHLVNFLSGQLPFGTEEKQALIESVDLDERTRLLSALLEMYCTPAEPAPALRH